MILLSCRKERVDLVWEYQPTGTDLSIHGISFNGETGTAVGGDSWYYGMVLSTENSGQSWQLDSLTDKQMLDVHLRAGGEAFITGIDGQFFYRPDPEAGWNFYRWPAWEPAQAICTSDAGVTLTAGGAAYRSGMIMRLRGRFELDSIYTFDFELGDICFSDAQTAHAVGYGNIMRSEDGGQSWDLNPIDGDFFRSVHFPTTTTGYAVGSAGTILKTTDGGRQWKVLRKGGAALVSDKPFRSVFFRDAENGYIAGLKGLLWRTRNGGESWEVIDNLPAVDLLDLFLAANEGWLAGEEGTIIHFSD